jgi:hypothetical protein
VIRRNWLEVVMSKTVLVREPSNPVNGPASDSPERARLQESPTIEAFSAMLALRPEDLRREALQELRREAGMSVDARRSAAHRRLTAWLELDPEDARILARAFDEASAVLDRESARARYEAERDAIFHGLRFDQFTRLVELVPWLRSRLGLVVLGSASPHAGDADLLPAA